MNTYHIHINGIVQGVGFRPMVYHLAKKLQLNGYVKNGADGVHIFFNSSKETANLFFNKIKEEAPKNSIIIDAKLATSYPENFNAFTILVDATTNADKLVLLSPDIALCTECKNELHKKNNRRYRYPFITCTKCGPRYSIINDLPFERHCTEMKKFIQCKSCADEYNNITNPRFFSQTNSCTDCGIKLVIYENKHSMLSSNSAAVLTYIKSFLIQGKIIAVKGIGGYLLLCDANNEEAIQLLRTRKNRPSKPFAVLFPTIENVENSFELNNLERELLQSNEAPIVLLYPKATAQNNLSIKNIAAGLNRVGVMIPYSPLLELIATDYNNPLIATSGNISGSPIVYKDEDALEYLFEMADYIVGCNRAIVVPQDDSVVQVSKYTHQQIIIRRSRGYAPSFLTYHPLSKAEVVSTGAFLKSSFTLSVNENIFVSQFLGSGENYDSQQMYKETLMHWLKMYEIKPRFIVADLHPNYFSHQYALQLAAHFGAAIINVQHHEAHFAAVLAENNLLKSTTPVLGVIWDGTGLGTDGNLWGGEFFKYQNKEILRCYHFDYFPAIAADKLALEPRIAALCTTNDTWPVPTSLKQRFTKAEWNNYQSLLQQSNLFSSSVGRIFDAVASLLNICDKQTYEGEAAMYLQTLAEKYVHKNKFEMYESYFKKDAHYYRIPTASLMQGIMMDIHKGKTSDFIAAKFHYSLVCLIDIVAKNTEVEKICFSGGVFQNALLVDWIKKEYDQKYQLFFHQHLSPNDENISFGQLVYHDNHLKTINTNELFSYKPEIITQHS